MAVDNTILVRRGSGTPSYSDFAQYELAYDYTNDKLYIRDGNAMVEVGSSGGGATGDIDGVTAGTGLSGGGTSGTVTLNIDSTVATLTGSQTLTNKTIASPAFTGDINFTDASTPQFTITDTTNSVSVRLDTDDNTGRLGTSSDHNLLIRRNSVNYIQLYGAYTMHNQGGNDIDFRAKDSSGNVVFKINAGTSKTEISTLLLDSVSVSAIQSSGESFADNDTSLMTSAAIQDKITSYGYITSDTTLSTEQVQDIAGGMFSSNTETGIAVSYVDGDGTIDLTVDYLPAIDDRDVKPSAITTSARKQVRAYFTSLGGLTGTANNDYQDLLVLSTYSDGTGGDVNALAFDKSEQKIRHYLADQSDTSWGTAKVLAYEDTFSAGTGLDLSGTTFSVDVSDFMSNGASGRVLRATGTDAMSASTNVTIDGNHLELIDSGILKLGSDADLKIQHTGSHGYITNDTGHLYIRSGADDKQINIQADDGSGGMTDYMRFSGDESLIRVYKNMRFLDSVNLQIGSGNDLQLKHDGSDSYIANRLTGSLNISNQADDADINIKVKDGGSQITAMKIDASEVARVQFQNDNQVVAIGASDDLQFYHDATDSYMLNQTGDLIIKNTADDKDIKFQSDNGSGGVTEYYRLNGDNATNVFSKNVVMASDAEIYLDTGGESVAFMGVSDANYRKALYSTNDDHYLTNRHTGGDLILMSNNGSAGGETERLRFVAGSGTQNAYFSNVNVGIGTTSPAHSLHVYHTANFEALKIETNAGGALMRATDSTGVTETGTQGGSWVARTASTARLTINQSGTVYIPNNVGIGTASPARKLEVAGGIELSADDNTIDTNNFTLRRGSGGVGHLDTPGNIRLNIDANNNQTNAFFEICANASTTPVFKVGETGIVTTGTWNGTAIASAYLDSDTAHLSGSQTFSGAKTFTGRLTISDAGADGLHLNQDTGATTNSNRLFFTGNSGSCIMQEADDLSFRSGATAGSSSGTERFKVNTSGATAVGNLNVTGNSFLQYGLVVNEGSHDADFRVESNSNTHMIQADAGNSRVGINTASPSYDFHVTGHAYASSSFLGPNGSAGTPSYRFHNDGNTGMYLAGTDTIGFSTNGTERITIEDDGDIRLKTPDDKRVYFGLNNSASFRASAAGYNLFDSSDGHFYIRNTVNGSNIYFGVNDGSTQYPVAITSTQRVGIGTTSPSAKLDVKSQINVTNSSNATMVGLKATNFGYSTSYKALQIGNTSGTYSIALGYDPSTNSSSSFTGDGREVIFRNGVEFTTPNSANNGFHNDVMVLKDGTIGIGTASPTKTLHVEGSTRLNGDVIVGPNNNNSKAFIKSRNGYSTATTPDYTWYYNDQCGIFHPAGNTIGFSASGEKLRLSSSGASFTGDMTINGHITMQSGHYITAHNESDYAKYRMYAGSSVYAIGMKSGNSYGGLNNDWAMTFTFNDDADRGFLWRDSSHGTGSGAMALTTNGKLSLAHSARIGYGETESVIPGATYRLDVNGHAYVKGPDGWDGNGDKAIVALGSGVSNEMFGCGYVYGTGLVLSTYKSSGGGHFGSSTQNGLIIADTTGAASFINDVIAYASSDERLKENVKPLDNALDKIEKINGVEFDWIDGKDEHGNSVHSNEGHDVGVIAQEIEEVLPEVVTTRDNGYKAVKYEKIVPLLIEAIKEQQEQINKLEEKLNG